LFTSKKSGTVSARRKVAEVTKEEAAREIEEHIKVLADYDVIPFDVAETLTEYIWKILTGSREDFGNVSELKDYWNKLENDEDTN
jgi:deoxyxylulose-5-phosphate synthase